jgi:hypothetical protein
MSLTIVILMVMDKWVQLTRIPRPSIVTISSKVSEGQQGDEWIQCQSVCSAVIQTVHRGRTWHMSLWILQIKSLGEITRVFLDLKCKKENKFLFIEVFHVSWSHSSNDQKFVTVLGPTQPPIQLVTGALSLGVKRPGREADHSPPPSAEVKECVELYPYSPYTPDMVLS